MASRVPFLIYSPLSFQNNALVISDAIFGKVGHDEAMILTWDVHDPLEHVLIGLSLMRDRGYPRDGIFEPDRRQGLLPRSYSMQGRAASIAFLLSHVDQ